MKSTHAVVGLMVLLAGVVVCWERSDAQAPPRAVAPVARIAVCDVGALFNGYARRTDLNALFEKKRAQAKAEDDRRIKEIEQGKKVLENLNANTTQHAQQFDKIQQLTLQREVWRQFQEQKFVREHRVLMEDLYQEILSAIAAAARQKGYDLVIYRDSVEVQSNTTSELLNKIAQRKCLYHNPAIDLTQPVLSLLNQRYRAKPKP